MQCTRGWHCLMLRGPKDLAAGIIIQGRVYAAVQIFSVFHKSDPVAGPESKAIYPRR